MSLPRNPLAGPNRRVNVPKVEPDKKKTYKRRPKHQKKDQE